VCVFCGQFRLYLCIRLERFCMNFFALNIKNHHCAKDAYACIGVLLYYEQLFFYDFLIFDVLTQAHQAWKSRKNRLKPHFSVFPNFCFWNFSKTSNIFSFSYARPPFWKNLTFHGYLLSAQSGSARESLGSNPGLP
jgi:hypothetical protein